MQFSRPTWIEVDTNNLRQNIREINNFISDDVKLGVVLKANAYGHGAVEVIKAIKDEKIDYICVASLAEAMELRNNNISKPILVLGYIEENCISYAIENNIIMTVFSKEQAIKISKISSFLKREGKVHIKIDTGFNRLGFKVKEVYNNKEYNKKILKDLIFILNLSYINVEGIFSHLALTNEESDQNQYNKFKYIVEEIEKYKKIPIKHICDSISMCKYREFHMDMVRVGSCIYGYNSRNKDLNLKRVMDFKTKIIQTKDIQKGEGISYDFTFIAQKDMKIGVLPCGYADGIPRELSNKGYVNINGKRSNIIGNICMDQCIIDITHLDESEYGDDVIFYGQNGPDLSEIAYLANTNKNEILSRVSKRVNRVYIDRERVKNTTNNKL